MGHNVNENEIVEQFANVVGKIKAELKKKIIGQQDIINDLIAGFLTGGHCLIVGVPGLAKTMLVQSLAKCLALDFNRIQFTPDLMPSDITGSEILSEDRTTGTRNLRFVHGPIFSNIVLADEINRTPPKTQSALLQAMQEHEITSSGKTYSLPDPFWVLATQNPIEQEGTYPLPEAQQDRFMFSVVIDYPDFESELEIVRSTTTVSEKEIEPIVSLEQIQKFKSLVWQVPVTDSLVRAAVRLARATRPSSEECPEKVKKLITWGAGPRASQNLILASKAYALIDNRPSPDISDLEKASFPVLRHRIVRSFHAEVDSVSTDDIIKCINKEILK
ncbi:MAG: MoxR family ATPase [Fibrobacter sp.]|nr:MoxR family ATPase [Fibrobacter sp.]